ncbi:MAG: hypothetical protein JXA54_13385 [Candidatus Heimdallarchaeota archaeon]|nr:hypothetical protein [Candidatus Heimdallarchaeota archaeon]
MDNEFRESINKLRKKRNVLFHLDSKRCSKDVSGEEAFECLQMAFQLFYFEIGLEYHKNDIDYNEVREKITDFITQNLPSIENLTEMK